MSCGCESNNPRHCSPCPPSAPLTTESLPSALDNFIREFFGTIIKVVDPDTGLATWTLPCDLATGLPDNPRMDGEGLACYFKRLFLDGITGLQGEQGLAGDDGANGTDGNNAYTVTTATFVPASVVDSVVTITVTNPAICIVGELIFVEAAGYYEVTGKTGSDIAAKLVVPLVSPTNPVPIGSLVLPTGPQGARGVKGGKGDIGETGLKGDKGDTGEQGATGPGLITHTSASWVVPVIGSTVSVPVAEASFFQVSQQVDAEGAGYYEVVSVSGLTLTLRNVGSPANADAGVTILSGGAVFICGNSMGTVNGTVTASGTDFAVGSSYAAVAFGTTQVSAALPMPGKYQVFFKVQLKSGGTHSPQVNLKLYNSTSASDVVGSEVNISLTADNGYFYATLSALVSVASASVIQIWAQRDVTGTVSILSAQSQSYFVRVATV